MKILIVSSTQQEIEFLTQKLDIKESLKVFSGEVNTHFIKILITGIGIPNTIFHLTKILENEKFDFVINAGIAGTFNESLKLGDIVEVKKDCFADLGYEDNEKFVPFTKTDLFDKNEFPFTEGWLVDSKENTQFGYKKVTGITVNKVHGNEKSIAQMQHIYNSDVETMEGAAVAFCCLQYHVNFIQLRAISNKVEKRDKENWNIPLAIKNLNIEIERVLKLIK